MRSKTPRRGSANPNQARWGHSSSSFPGIQPRQAGRLLFEKCGECASSQEAQAEAPERSCLPPRLPGACLLGSPNSLCHQGDIPPSQRPLVPLLAPATVTPFPLGAVTLRSLVLPAAPTLIPRNYPPLRSPPSPRQSRSIFISRDFLKNVLPDKSWGHREASVVSRVGFTTPPHPHTVSSRERAFLGASSTKEGHPFPSLRHAVAMGKNQEHPPLLCSPGALPLGGDTRQYDVTLWTVCNYVHQRPVLGTGERPWGTSGAFLKCTTFMSPAERGRGSPTRGGTLPLTHSPWAQLPLAAGGALGGWVGHPLSLPPPL